MILRDEQAHGRALGESIVSEAQPMYGPPNAFTFVDLRKGVSEIHNAEIHHALKADLVQHVWDLKGQG